VTAKKKRYLYGAIVLVLAVGYLLYLSFSSSISYYVTVSEFYSRGTELHNKDIRVAGIISEPVEMARGNTFVRIQYPARKDSGLGSYVGRRGSSTREAENAWKLEGQTVL